MLLHIVLVTGYCIVLSLGEPPLPSPYGRIHLKPPQRSSQEARRIVDQRLLDRVADIISRGGDGSEEPQGTEGMSLVNSELLDRISRIISQNANQQNPQDDLTPGGAADQNRGINNSPPSNNQQYGAPPSPFISYTYGPPHPQVAKLATTLELERPFAARRIASFMLEDDQGNSGRGDNELSESYYNSYGSQQFQIPQYAASSDSYISSLPSRNTQQESQIQNRLRFVDEPQMADSIAAFDIDDNTSSNNNEGYNRN